MQWLTAPVQNWGYVIFQDINVVFPKYHIVFIWFEVLKEVSLLSTMMSRKETRVRRRVSLDVIAHFQFSWLWSAFACFAPPTSKHKLSFSVFKIFFIKVLFHMVPFAYLVIMVLHDLGCHITCGFGTWFSSFVFVPVLVPVFNLVNNHLMAHILSWFFCNGPCPVVIIFWSLVDDFDYLFLVGSLFWITKLLISNLVLFNLSHPEMGRKRVVSCFWQSRLEVGWR